MVPRNRPNETLPNIHRNHAPPSLPSCVQAACEKSCTASILASSALTWGVRFCLVGVHIIRRRCLFVCLFFFCFFRSVSSFCLLDMSVQGLNFGYCWFFSWGFWVNVFSWGFWVNVFSFVTEFFFRADKQGSAYRNCVPLIGGWCNSVLTSF